MGQGKVAFEGVFYLLLEKGKGRRDEMKRVGRRRVFLVMSWKGEDMRGGDR